MLADSPLDASEVAINGVANSIGSTSTGSTRSANSVPQPSKTRQFTQLSRNRDVAFVGFSFEDPLDHLISRENMSTLDFGKVLDPPVADAK